MDPYFQDDFVTLFHGDWREEVDSIRGDAVVTDPPYGETPLVWDRWPVGWPGLAAGVADAMWCFGSFRMFMDHRDDFEAWKFSHEVVWRKHTSTSVATDKFRRVHELAAFWYQGAWADVHHVTPKVQVGSPYQGRTFVKASATRSQTMGAIGAGSWYDDGTRYQSTVIEARNGHRRSIHPTQKPLGVLTPLIEYSVPKGGVVVDLFSGSGSVAVAARDAGRRCVAFEVDEAYCEASALRLSQQGFDFGDWGAE